MWLCLSLYQGLHKVLLLLHHVCLLKLLKPSLLLCIE